YTCELSASGSSLSAPAWRTVSRYCAASTCQLPSSHRFAAAIQAGQSQRILSSSESTSLRKAVSALCNTGTPAGYPTVTRSASPSSSRYEAGMRCDVGGAAGGAGGKPLFAGSQSAASLVRHAPPLAIQRRWSDDPRTSPRKAPPDRY